MRNKHYRERTPEQVQKKIDKLKTDFMVKKVMGNPSILDILRKSLRRIGKKPHYREQKQEVGKIKRLERKLRRMENGKWRKGNAKKDQN